MGTTTEAYESGEQNSSHPYSGKSVIALALGLCAVFVPAPFNIALALAGVIAALLARRSLREDPELRGTFVSLLAFLICGAVLVSGILHLYGSSAQR